ncbi:MAG: hypothetical protein ABJF01_20945 [bacterium]
MYPSAELVSLAMGRDAPSAVPAFFAQPIIHDRDVARRILGAHIQLLDAQPDLAGEEMLLLQTNLRRDARQLRRCAAPARVTRLLSVPGIISRSTTHE